jgi:hypothetical protein
MHNLHQLVATLLLVVSGIFACGPQQKWQPAGHAVGTVLSLAPAQSDAVNQHSVLEMSLNGKPILRASGEIEFVGFGGTRLGVFSVANTATGECFRSISPFLNSDFAPVIFCDRNPDLAAVASVIFRDADGLTHVATNISVVRSHKDAGVAVYSASFF